MERNENLQKVYTALKNEGYTDIGDFNSFSSMMSDSNNVRKVYDGLLVSGYTDLGDFDTFKRNVYQSSVSLGDYRKVAEETHDAQEPQVEDGNRFGILGKMGKYMGSPSAYIPTPQVVEKKEPTPEELKQMQDAAKYREDLRIELQDSGAIDSMKDAKKEARQSKFKALGEMLAYTPQTSLTGISSSTFSEPDVTKAVEAGREFTQNKLMESTLNEALDMARQGEKNLDGSYAIGDFARGVWDEAVDISTWDMGYSDLVNAATLNQLVQKYESDRDNLTATEKKVLEALGMSAAVQEAYAGTTGIGYAVGQSIPHSAAFIGQMALNPAKGAGEALAKAAIKKVGKQGVMSTVGKVGTRLLTEALETGVMTATTGAGRVAADALERINGRTEYTIDNDGYIVYGGQTDNETVRNAWWKAFGATFIEGYTESLGRAVFDPALDALKNIVGGKLKKGSLNKLGEIMLGEEPSRLAEAMRVLKSAGKVDSMVGELLEEEVGMIINALTVGDQSLDPEDPNFVFNLENQLSTLISTALMTGTINAAEAAGDYFTRRDINKKANDAEKVCRALYGEGWDTMRDKMDSSTPEEAVQMLSGIMQDPTIEQRKKAAMLEYASKRITAQYFNAEDEKVRESLVKEKRELHDAFNAGLEARLPDFYNMRKAIDGAKAALDEYGEKNNRMEEINAAIRGINESPEKMNEILSGMSEEEQNLIRDYVYSRTRMNGAYVGRSNKLEDYVDEFAFAMEPFVVTNENGDRTITTANLDRVSGSIPVYVMSNDGTNAWVMREDGSSNMVLTKELKNIFTKNAEDVIEAFRQQATETMDAETENAVKHHPKTQSPRVGLVLTNTDGTQMVVTEMVEGGMKIAPAVFKDGQYLPKGGAATQTITTEQAYGWQDAYNQKQDEKTSFKIGTEQTFYLKGKAVKGVITGIGPDENYNVDLEEDVEGYDKVGSYTLSQMREMTTPPTGTINVLANQPQNEGTPTEEIKQSVSEEVTNGQNAATTSQPTEQGKNVKIPTAEVAESVNTALSRVPKDAEGNPLYEQTDADTAWDAIMEQTEGDTEMAQRIAEEMVADKKAALDKMKKGKPKKGATVAEKITNEKAHIAAIAQAEQEVVAWEEIAQTEARRREAAMSEADRYATEMEQKNISEGLRALGEPQSLQEYVLAQLAGGAYKLRWNDKENGTKGFGSHTGLSTEEMKARLSMVDNKNGLTPEEIAHSIVENMDASFGEVDVMDVTDMVIDAVSTYASRRAMLNGMVESRAKLLRQQEIAEQEAKDAWYMEQYHATEEELAAYNEYLAEFAEEIYGEDSYYEQRIATFAEIQLEYDNQGTDAGLRSSADQGEGLTSDREGGRSMGETEQLDRREVLSDADRMAEAEDEGTSRSVSEESDVIETIKSELGVFSADNAAEYAARMFEAYKWKTLEEANESLKQLLASYGQKLAGQTLGVVPFLDAAQDQINAERDWQRYQEDVEADASSPVYTEERLDNGDVRVTGTNSNGQIASVAIERDGKVISVDNYDDGVLFERTDYDANGNATKVTRYKDGEVVSEQEYKDGKRKVTANVFEMTEEAQRKRKSKKKSNDKLAEKNHQQKENRSETRGVGNRPQLQDAPSYESFVERVAEYLQRSYKGTELSEEVAQIIRDFNKGKTILARTEQEKELLKMLRVMTNKDVDWLLSELKTKRDALADEERKAYDDAVTLVSRYRGRGEHNAVVRALTGANLREKLPLTKIDELFDKYNSDANVAELYRRVRNIAEQIGLDFWFDDNMIDAQAGGFRGADNRVRFNAHMLYSPFVSDQTKASVIVHEMLHAVADYAIETQRDVKLGLTPKVQLSKQVLSAANTILNIYEKAVKDNPLLVHEEYDNVSGEMKVVPDYGTTSAREMLMEISNPEFRDKLMQIEYNGRSVWQRIWDAIKSMFTQSSDVTNPTAYDSMAKALDVLINEFSVDAYQKYSGRGEESAARVYHGSGADFDRFDHSFMGTGEGNQSFGWGTYVSESNGVAKTYAEISARNVLFNSDDNFEAVRKTSPSVVAATVVKQEMLRNNTSFADAKRMAEENFRFTVNDTTEEWDDDTRELAGRLADAAAALTEEEVENTPYGGFVYDVEIPDDNGSNYLKWYENVPKEVLAKAKAKLYGVLVEGDYKGAERELKRELDDLFALEQTGQNLYGNISAYLGSDKEASQFLHEMGYVGLKYPTNTLHGGNIDGTSNYVIFNENDLEIVDNIRFRDGKEKPLETALLEDESSFKGTAVSSDDGAKVLKDIDNAISEYENKSTQTKNFIGDVARALGIDAEGKSSKYATFEAMNGDIVTIRISDHNATVSNFDNNGEENGVSIVVSRRPNEGINNDGDAHVVEFFYSDKKLKSSEDKPLVEILKSIKQALYSGEYKDNTGLAEREEVNERLREGMGAVSDREVSYENDPIAKWQGKPRYYGKKAAAFAERERRRMENAAKEAAEMLGIEVEIITDASTLKGRKSKAKGWYDINSKKVMVVVPNHVSKGDAVRTVLHEGVAHHGLRELFGAGFDAMLDNIYNNVAPELKARIDAIAERTGVSTSVATEEYLASLAEETNFEEAKNRGWWSKIKKFFVDMLRKLSMSGLNLKEEITDNELRYLLWRSYQNLVDPNSYLKPLGYLDDVAKQKELKVGNYAENTMATPRAAEMSEAEEWSAITMQRIEELEAQAAQLENEIADMEADRDADDESRYNIWEQQIDPLREQLEDVYAEIQGLYSLEAEDEDIEDYEAEREAEKQRQLYQKRIDNEYLKAVREGNWGEATDLFRQYVLSKAEDEGIVPMDYGVGYRGGAHSSIAKKVKEENPDAIAEAAYQMSIRIPKGSILVPMPSRTGNATYTVKLAEAIAKATDSEVRDVLKGKARMSVYEAKQKGIKMTPEDLGMYTTEELPKGKNIVIIDNVIDKGTTALAAVSAVKGASVVAYAYTLGDKQRAATLKLAEPVTYDDNKRIIPLSQRFDKETDDIRYRMSINDEEFDNTQREAVRNIGIVMPNLGDAEVNIVDVPRHDFTGTGNEAISKAKEWANRELVGEHVANEGTKEEFKYSIDEKSVKKFLSGVSTSLSDNLGVHLSVLKKLPSVIDSSIEAEIHADYKKGEQRDANNGIEDENLLIHRLYGCAKINGELYRVKTTIKERKSAGVKPYTYEVTKIELLDGSSQEGTSSSDASSNSISGAKLLKGVEKSYDKGKLLLDESKKVSENSINSEEIIAEVERESANLGVQVRIARNIDELPDEDTRKRAEDGKLKGYFDTRTGEVVVYEPNTNDANDAKRTILHEIVGHKGLRQLLGEDNFNKTMVQMYRMLPEEERKKVWDASIMKYGDLAEAMEEYLAEKAENAEKPSFLQRLWMYLKVVFKRQWNTTLTDADINYLLWRGRKKLASDTPMDMVISKILKQAAMQSDVTEDESVKLEEARERLFNGSGRERYLRNRTGDAQREYEDAVNTLAYKSQEASQDSMLALKTLQEAVAKESGKEIRDWENAYMAENRMSSINLRDHESYKKTFYKKLLMAVSDIMDMGVEHDAILNYMMAKHGLERNEVFAQRDAVNEAEGDTAKQQELYEKNRKTDYAGLTALTGMSNVEDAEAEAQRMVDEFEQKVPKHLVDELWRRNKACNQRTLDITYNAGLMDLETYNKLSNQFQYYVPLQGFDETTAEEVYFYVGGKDSPYNAPIKAARGRKSKADNPIATIGSVAESAIVDANRNKMKQEFYAMAVNHKTSLISVSDVWMAYDPASDSWVAQFPTIPNDATPSQVKSILDAFEARMEAAAAANPDLYAKASEKPNVPYRVVKKADMNEHQVIVKRNGRDVVMTINGNPRAAQAINGLTNPEANKNLVNDIANWINRNLSANFTTRNPAFVISNFVRDSIYTNSMVWVKESPMYAKKYHKNFLKATTNITSLVNKYKRYEEGDKSALDMNDPLQKMFYEFMANGGETGYTAMHSVDDYKRMSQKELKKLLRKGAMSNAQKVVDVLAEGLDTFGRWAEDTSRFAAYMTSREMGRSVARSIYDAKEISVNFNKKGAGSRMRGKFKDDPMAFIAATISQMGRNLYVFWNAGVQGLTNFGRAAKENKGKFSVMAMAAMAAGILIPVIFSTDDDEDDEYYLLPEYVRRNNICIKVGKNKFITLPLPIEIRALYGMGELAYSYLSGKEEMTTGEATKKVIQQISQVMPIDMMADGGGAMALVPSAVKPVVEAIENKNWTGDPIYRKETVFNENDPTWMLAYKSTSPELVWLSRQISEATNENTPSGEERKYDRGWADNRFFNNPAVWEHIFEGYLGGVATITNQTKKTLIMPFNEDLQDIRNVPVVSRFVKSAGENTKEYKLVDEYYGALDIMDELSDELSSLKKDMRDASKKLYGAKTELEKAKAQREYDNVYKVYNEMNADAYGAVTTTKSLNASIKKLEDRHKTNPDEKIPFNGEMMLPKDAINKLRKEVIDNVSNYMNN